MCEKTRLIERNLVPLIDEINMNYNHLANDSMRSFIPYVNILHTIRTNILHIENQIDNLRIIDDNYYYDKINIIENVLNAINNNIEENRKQIMKSV